MEYKKNENLNKYLANLYLLIFKNNKILDRIIFINYEKFKFE